MLVSGQNEVHTGALKTFDRVSGVVDDVALAPRSGDGQQMVVADEDPQVRRIREALLDPGVTAPADLTVVEVGLRRVDRHHGDAVDPHHGVAIAEQLLEMDVADVAGIVVPWNDDNGLAVDPVEVVLGERVLLLEPERGQVTGADDDVRLEVVDLRDRTLQEVRQEKLRPAVQIRDLDDRERAVPGRHARSLGGQGKPHSQRPDRLLR